MDPLYRFEGHLIRKDHYWIGVENKGLGPAENVTISPRFKSASDEWSLVTDPYISVLQKGEKQEFELAAKHFDRKPTEMVVTVAYDDLTGTHHSKSVRFTLD